MVAQTSEPKQKRGRKEQPVYRVKGSAAPEEEVVPPETQARSKSRKNQPIYRRKGEAEAADEGEEGASEEQKKPKGGKAQGKKRREPPKEGEEVPTFTSAYHEYNAGYWKYRPRKEKVLITLETQIPPMPKPVLEYPDESAYHKSQTDIDEKIDAINLKIKELGERFNERLQ